MKCPYNERNRRICTHKGCKPNRGGKRVCGFKHPHNCEMFLDWVEGYAKDKERSLREGGIPIGDLSQ